MIGPGSKALIAEWSCGHLAGSMCQECYRELAHKAGMLAEEGRLHREEIVELRQERDRLMQHAQMLADERAIVTQERDEAWAKIDQLLGRTQ